RAGVLKDWSTQFGFTQLELGAITGGGLVGFGVVILLASLITDHVGYKKLLVAAFILHVLSAVVTLAATPIFNASDSKDATYWCLYIGMFMFAVANGLCEAVINPLTATLYPTQKTHYLNILHAGWPGGLILGGLIGYFIVGRGDVAWEIPMALFLIPTAIYGLMIFGARFPISEARAAGVGYGEMLVQLASPILLFLLVLHACVGYVELGTDSWITNITNSILTGQGFLLFIYAASIMFVLRFFAGPIVEKINPLGLLFSSACVACLGLVLLGTVGGMFLWVAVTVYGLGKTFFWPTMLGVVGERFPRGGAITMGAMGGVGMLSAGLLGGPAIGYKQDYYASASLKEASAPAYERYAAAEEKAFGPFPKIRGLDGAKVGVLLDENGPAAGLQSEVKILKDQGTQLKAIDDLDAWWNGEAKEHAETDKAPVSDARIHGGHMALLWTAVVPAFMALGYLLLLLYFRATGGYKQVELSTQAEDTEGGG
ncbi:MAG: MFS transporter, partial [Planctomycetota bacterium]|nr:MFS transporter [Planctomycetota bacterium]